MSVFCGGYFFGLLLVFFGSILIGVVLYSILGWIKGVGGLFGINLIVVISNSFFIEFCGMIVFCINVCLGGMVVINVFVSGW